MSDTTNTAAASVDRRELEERVKAMYREVAEAPAGEFHFEMGRPLAERLGYDPLGLTDPGGGYRLLRRGGPFSRSGCHTARRDDTRPR